jgi:hypothetical protein
MAQRHLKRLPVVDAAGLLEGIVSRSDLLKVFLRSDEVLADEIRRTVTDLSHLGGAVTYPWWAQWSRSEVRYATGRSSRCRPEPSGRSRAWWTSTWT